MATNFEDADEPTSGPTPIPVNLVSIQLGEWLRELIYEGSATMPRSQQRAIGMSEVGGECDREIAYKLAGTTPTRFDDDPMVTIVGTGIHLVLADMFRRIDNGRGRWLIEHPVEYQGIPGSADAYDRRKRLLIDWKSTAKSKIRRIAKDGPPRRYIVQSQLYAQALRQIGEDPQRIAIVYLARDGKLDDLFVWPLSVDPTIADAAVGRLNDIKKTLEVKNAGSITPTPTHLCGWCDWCQPGSTNTNIGCPGKAA